MPLFDLDEPLSGEEAVQLAEALADAGERPEVVQKRKMVVADCTMTMTPSDTFSSRNAGNLSGLLSMVPVVGGAAAMVAGNINMKLASTVLTLVDNRSSVQFAAATGSARNMDVGATDSIMSSPTPGSIGGYADTPEGKVIVAAFTDSLNNLVDFVRAYKAQHVQGGLGNGGQLKVAD